MAIAGRGFFDPTVLDPDTTVPSLPGGSQDMAPVNQVYVAVVGELLGRWRFV